VQVCVCVCVCVECCVFCEFRCVYDYMYVPGCAEHSAQSSVVGVRPGCIRCMWYVSIVCVVCTLVSLLLLYTVYIDILYKYFISFHSFIIYNLLSSMIISINFSSICVTPILLANFSLSYLLLEYIILFIIGALLVFIF